MEVFWERGYEAASLAELLERMGIARKSLYDTFGCKRTLFLRALDLYDRRMLEALRDRLRAPGSPLANVLGVLDQWEAGQSCPSARGCMLGTNMAHVTPEDQDLMGVLERHASGLVEVLAEALEAARDAGELRDGVEPLDLARLLVAAAQGSALMGRISQDRTLPGSVFKACRVALGAT